MITEFSQYKISLFTYLSSIDPGFESLYEHILHRSYYEGSFQKVHGHWNKTQNFINSLSYFFANVPNNSQDRTNGLSRTQV